MDDTTARGNRTARHTEARAEGPLSPTGPGRGVLARYLAAAVMARIADEGARVSLVLLAVQVTGSAALGGVLIAALLLPHVLAAPVVGLVIDRSRHPRWVLAAGVLVVAGGLLSAVLLGTVPLWASVGLLLVGGCCGPVVTGGLTSRLPALVGPERTPRAFALDSLLYNVASMVGPALAGILAATSGARTAQVVLAGCAAVGAAGVATLPLRSAPSGDRGRAGLGGGAREIWRVPVLRVVTLSSTVGQVGPGGLAVVAVVLATSWQRPAVGGLLLTTVAAGSLIGSVLCAWRPVPPERSARVTTLAMVGVGAPLALAAAAPSPPVTLALFGLSGVCIGPFGAALFTARTRYAAEAVRTQVFTIGAGLKVTASAAGAALIGLAAGLPAPVQLLLVAASPMLAGGLGALALRGRATGRAARSPVTVRVR